MRFLASLFLILTISVAAVAAPPAVEKAAKDSTALVEVQAGKYSSRGSAAYIGGGLFITNQHVVDGVTGDITISVPNTEHSFQAKILATHHYSDIAILITLEKVTGLKPVELAGRTPRLGKIYAAGYGSSMHDDKKGEFLRVYGGGYGDFTLGNKSWYRFGGDEGCSISGDSGGPAFNAEGKYIGPIWGSDKKNTYAVRFCHTFAFISGVLP